MKFPPAIFLLVCVLGGASREVAYSQSFDFTSIAGQVGVSGSIDGTNDQALFRFPAGLAIDDKGALFVADLLNHTIRRVTPEGTNWVVTTIAGRVRGYADGTNSDARFDHPTGVTVDLAGNVFVADKYNDTIRKITPIGTNWVVTTIAGQAGVQAGDDGTNSDAHFWGPSGIVVDRSTNLFVVDSSNFTIRRIVPEGTNWVVTTLAGTATNPGFVDDTNEFAEFDYPYSIAVNSAGTLYVTDYGNHAIREVVPIGKDWVTTTIAGFSGLHGTNDGLGSTAAFYYPMGVAVDTGSNVFVTDQSNYTIRKLEPAGTDWMVSTIGGVALQRGSANGTGASARFDHPWGIAMDKAGNLFVADYSNQTIRKGTLLPVPSLQIVGYVNQVVVSWPLTASDYVLETVSTLDAAASWTALTNGIATSVDSFVLTNNVAATPAFYRLRKQ